MQAIVTISENPVVPSAFLPPSLADHFLYGSRCFYFSGSYGYLLAQFLDTNPHAVLYTISAINKDTNLSLSCLDIGFICHFTLDSPMSVNSFQTGYTLFHAQSLMLVFSSAWIVTADLKEKESYRSLTLMFPASVVLERLRLFPALDALKNDIQESKPFYIPDAIYPLSVHLVHMLNQLLGVPYTFLSREFYHSVLVSVLSEVFAHMQVGDLRQPLFTLTNLQSVESAKQWIDKHLDTHFTIGELSRKVGINEFKLKKGFREIYGIGLYGYLLQQRLMIARINLEQTIKSIQQIARQAGYRNAANFSAAFRRQYGITPHQFRLQNRPK